MKKALLTYLALLALTLKPVLGAEEAKSAAKTSPAESQHSALSNMIEDAINTPLKNSK